MKLTDEQYLEIWRAAMEVQDVRDVAQVRRIKAGRAAYEAVRPLVLAEALAEPDLPEIEQYAEVIYSDYNMPPVLAKLIAERVIRLCVSNRLASVTAKPDPAVEAVKALPELNGWSEQARKSAAERIVAAVDAARAAK